MEVGGLLFAHKVEGGGVYSCGVRGLRECGWGGELGDSITGGHGIWVNLMRRSKNRREEEMTRGECLYGGKLGRWRTIFDFRTLNSATPISTAYTSSPHLPGFLVFSVSQVACLCSYPTRRINISTS